MENENEHEDRPGSAGLNPSVWTELNVNERIYTLEKEMEWLTIAVPVLAICTYFLVRRLFDLDERLAALESVK